jgi:hypothetical protein
MLHDQTTADGGRRCIGGQKYAPTAVGGYGLSATHAKHEISGLSRRRFTIYDLRFTRHRSNETLP